MNSGQYEAAFSEVLALIATARQRTVKAVNTCLIDLYWKIGEYISQRIAKDGWGKGTVTALAIFISRHHFGQRGFSPQNLWRMRQFFEAYQEMPELSTALRESHPTAGEVFRDAYFFEFLGLPHPHSERDLHLNLVQNLGRFITELGRDFCFVGSEYPLQVGGKDFALDLLFFHRGLNCLVAIELKVGEFQPEHLGKLEFYLEALDRDIKKPHEHPAIGVLLCATKDSEVVEYALSRSLSPALVAEYQTKLPDKELLQAKLHEFYALLSSSE